MSIKLMTSVAVTAIALASSCAFAQSDLSSRVNALESQVNNMGSGSKGVVALGSDLSKDILGGHASVDQAENVKDAKMAANTIALGGYAMMGFQKSEYRGVNSNLDYDYVYSTGNGAGFDALNLGTFVRVGDDVTLVVALNTKFGSDNANGLKWNDASDTADTSREISTNAPSVAQAYGVWNINDQFYAFAGKKDLAFGDFSDNNFLTANLDRPVFAAVDSIGFGTNFQGVDMVATVYNTKQSVMGNKIAFNLPSTAGGGTFANDDDGVENFALNTSYNGLLDGLTVGAGYMNHFAQKSSGSKIGALTANASYAIPNTDLSISGNYTRANNATSDASSRRTMYSANASFNPKDSKFGLSVGYSKLKNGLSNPFLVGTSKQQTIISGTYDLNSQAVLGLEYGRANNDRVDPHYNESDAYNSITVDLKAWF